MENVSVTIGTKKTFNFSLSSTTAIKKRNLAIISQGAARFNVPFFDAHVFELEKTSRVGAHQRFAAFQDVEAKRI